MLHPHRPALLLAALLLAACHGREVPPAAPLPVALRQLKVLTFNVNFGAVDMERSAAVIRASNADVVALQETTPAWERHLRQALRGQYPELHFRHAGGAGGMAFLSRHPLTDLGQSFPPAGGWFPAWAMAARTPIGEITVMNLHLRPPLPESGRTSGIPTAYFATRPVRAREVQHHLESLPSRRPLLVLGDLNESDGGRAHRVLAARGLRSALARHDRSTPTWRWQTSLGPIAMRLDHIYHSPELSCVAARVLGEAASDHYPVEAVLARTR
jgi:endonuclease/exonuclease/phosphatase (EEP) superfamily protein YafD